MPNKSVREHSTREQKYIALSGAKAAKDVDLRSCPPEVFVNAIDAISRAGDAITFGRTSDGGAVYLGVLSGGVVHKYWAATMDELEALLQALAE